MTIVLDNPKLEQDIPLDRIHPDPFQPRLEPDDELADSIRSQGILQAITVEVITGDNAGERICPDCARPFADLVAEGTHFMIQDGERRFRGVISAGLKTILAKVVPPTVDEAHRIIRQLTANTGKPLTPVEEAFAFKRLMEETDCDQVQLARMLGRPRSVVGDRIRLVDLDPVWLDLITRGRLQVSHGPKLHLYAAVPARYQAEAAKTVVSEWLENVPDPMTIEDFQSALQDAFAPFIIPLSEVSPQYKGPVIGVSTYSGQKQKFAADPELWKPIAAEKAKRAKQSKAASTRSVSHREPSVLDQFPDLPQRKASSHEVALLKGEVRVWSEQGGWDREFLGVPSVFLAKVDRSKLTGIARKHYGAVLVTTDASAIAEANAAFNAELKAQVDEHVVDLVAQIAKHSPRFRVSGPGARTLLEAAAGVYNNPIPMLARAVNVKVEGLGDDGRLSGRGQFRISADVDADMLATAYIASVSGTIKVTPERDFANKLWQKYMRAPLKFPAIKKEKQVPIARGTEKAVDVGAMRAAVEADVAEGELEEANA